MRIARFILSLALMLVGAVALVMPRGYSVGFFVACILGLLLWLPKREALMDAKTKWLLWPCAAYALAHMAIGLWHTWAWRSLDPYVPFLLLFLGVWAVRRYKPSVVYLWMGLVLALLAQPLWLATKLWCMACVQRGTTTQFNLAMSRC